MHSSTSLAMPGGSFSAASSRVTSSWLAGCDSDKASADTALREFAQSNLHELTVHHKNHDHDHNPPDGSNWELLCIYCHDNEHQRELEEQADGPAATRPGDVATHAPFAGLKALLARGKR